MSDTINDGGPAFPFNAGHDGFCVPGMSLRAYLAGQALAGFCSAHDESGMWSWRPNDAAKEAVFCADALIAELAKGGAQ